MTSRTTSGAIEDAQKRAPWEKLSARQERRVERAKERLQTFRRSTYALIITADLPLPQRLVLIFFAAHASHQDGGNAMPAKEACAHTMKIALGTVTRSCKELEQAGYLVPEDACNGRPTVYRVDLGKLAEPAAHGTGSDDDGEPGRSANPCIDGTGSADDDAVAAAGLDNPPPAPSRGMAVSGNG